MPTLTVHRAEPFIRGDESISIWMDEHGIGTLPTTGPLVKEIPAGNHKLQAWMNGLSGRAIPIHAVDDEHIVLILSHTKIAQGSRWNIAAFVLLFLIPDHKLPAWGFWIKTGLLILLIAWSIFDWLKRRRDFLKLEITPKMEKELA